MSSPINITPQSTVRTISQIQILNTTIDLYRSATFTVLLKAEDGTIITSQNVHMPTAQYENWNSDDLFAEDYVLQQLGLTRAS